MEVDWGTHQLERYISDGDRILSRLATGEVRDIFLQRAFRFLIRYLQIPRLMTSQQADETMVRLANVLYSHIQRRGYWNQIAYWWPKVKAIAEELSDPDLKANAVRQLAIIENNQGNIQIAQTLYEDFLTSSDFALLSPFQQADLFQQVGVCYFDQGDYVRAGQAFRASLRISEVHNYWELKGNILNLLGSLSLWQGDFETANDYYQTSLHTFEANGEGETLACVVYHGLGRLRLLQGQIPQATTLLEKSRSISQRRYEIEGAADCAAYLAMAYAKNGKLEQAQHLLDEVKQGYIKLNHQSIRVLYYLALGLLKVEQEEPNMAIAAWQQALKILKKVPRSSLELLVLAILLPTLLRAGQTRQSGLVLLRLWRNMRHQNLSLWRLLGFLYRSRTFWL